MFKKIISSVLAVAMLSSMGTTVFAGTFSTTYNGSFAQTWQKYKGSAGPAFEAEMTYGFNTFLVNEDWTDGRHMKSKHQSFVRNGSGAHYGPQREPLDGSKVEAAHKGTSVTYGVEW